MKRFKKDNHFIWFVPVAVDPVQRKTFHCYESCNHAKEEVIHSRIGSIKQASAMIENLFRKDPQRAVAIDTSVESGRELFRRISQHLTFHSRGFSNRVFLTQGLQTSINHRNDRGVLSEKSRIEFFNDVIHRSRSNGGLRACHRHDVLVATIGVKNFEFDAVTAKKILKHPFWRATSFFVEEVKRVFGTYTKYDSKLLETNILHLIRSFAELRQSPFPILDHKSLFTGNMLVTSNKKAMKAFSQTCINDFIFAATEGPTGIREKALRANPVACEIVKRTDLFLKEINIESAGVFQKFANRFRSDRICGFLDLLFGAWLVSFYDDPAEAIPLVNFDLLSDGVKQRFETMLQSS